MLRGKNVTIEYAVQGGIGYIELENGFNSYRQKTKKDLINEGYKIVKDLDKYYKEYEENLCNNWVEISEESYTDALDVLPPVNYYNGGFFISEATFGCVHSFYQKYNNKYFTSNQNIFTDRSIIIQSLKEFYNNKYKNYESTIK